jgi:zinc protease
VKPERSVPLVALRAVFPGGLRYETEANNGLSQLYSRLMTRSTARRPAEAIAREIDELAGTLQASAGRNSISVRGEFLAKHFARSLELFAECINEPAFDAAELDLERGMLLQELAARDDHPSSVAFDLFARTLYTRHPYRLDVLGEEPSVKAVTTDDLRALRLAALHPCNLTLAIVGDVDPDRAFALCERLFASPCDPRRPEPLVAQEPHPTSPRRAFRELDKAQAHLVYGFLGTTVHSPQRYTLDVLSSVLSGQGGRLFVELRDRRSLAYSVSSFSVEGIDPGYFGVYMGTSPDKVKEALAGIGVELSKLLASRLPDEEIERAKRYLTGSHAIGLQKNSARAAMIAYDEAYGIGADAYLRYDEHIEAVTAEMVLQAARELLVPQRGTLAIIGPKAADVDFLPTP